MNQNDSVVHEDTERDDETELGHEPTIVSISLGASRRFLLRHQKDKHMPIYELVPEHGSLLIMAGSTQKFWRHSVPKSTHAVGQRVNLTFRLVRTMQGIF